jgi:hypothetical protein
MHLTDGFPIVLFDGEMLNVSGSMYNAINNLSQAGKNNEITALNTR